MDRRTEPPIWPPDESEIPDENEIPERRRRSPALLLFGWTFRAMAGFNGGSGAADAFNTSLVSADTSQQTLLTTPQHT
jgi:hypothetical protein